MLIPFIFLMIGCVESELVIDGENVGTGDGGDDDGTTITTILEKYEYSSPDLGYTLNFNSDGQPTSVSMTMMGAISRFSISYTDELISQLSNPSGTHSTQYTFTYDDNNRLVEINAGIEEENNIIFTYNDSTITGVRTIDGAEENTYTFTTDSYGYIEQYSFTDVTTNQFFEFVLELTGNAVNSSEFVADDTTIQSFSYTYDSMINPIQIQSIDYFNVLVLAEAFDIDVADPGIMINLYALLRSPNNIITSEAESGVITGTETFTYEYDSENYPMSATTTVEEEEMATVIYTYY